jgi:flavodoxin
MRRFLSLTLAFLLILSAAGCGQTAGTASPAAGSETADGSPSSSPSGTQDTSSKILVAYFSRSGNTRTLAGIIHESVGGDLFEITPSVPYPEDLNETITIATKELANKSRPEIASKVEDFESYDIIFIGYPIWSNSLPMIMATFLESYDLTGKTIVPFCTYGSGGIGNSVSDIKALCPDVTVLEAFSIKGAQAAAAQAEVEKWLEKLELS